MYVFKLLTNSIGLSGNGVDYISSSINATFAAGTTITTINIPVINDSIAEVLETFDLNLSIPLSLRNEVFLGKTTTAIGTITDNTGKLIF